jgi:hypothetical protein
MPAIRERHYRRKSSPICLIHPAPGCFPKAKSRDLNHLIMIHLYLARQTRGISIPGGVDEVPATGAAAE